MTSRWTLPCLLFAALVCTDAARPQTPPPPPASRSSSADTFFTGAEKFEQHASRVTRVENDHNRNRAAQPPHLSSVFAYTYDRPGLYNPADVDVYRSKLHTADWTCKTCEGRLKPGEAIDACTRPLGPSAVESVVIEMRLQRLTFVHTVDDASSGSHNVMTCREE